MYEPRKYGTEVTAHVCLPGLCSGWLWCRSEELLLLTSPSFITPYSNGIFPSVFRHIHQLHSSLFCRFDSPYECVCVWICVTHCVPASICVGHLSAVCLSLCMQALLNHLCECPCIKLRSHYHTNGFLFHYKNVSQFLFRGRDGTGVKGWWQRLA